MSFALFFHLGGDIDLLAPFLGQSDACGRPRVIVAEKLLAANPRLSIALGAHACAPHVILAQDADKNALRAALEGARVLLTASETTLRPHRLAHALTLEANAMGLRTFTMQHGVENVGLTYFDEYQGTDVTFASSHVLTWNGLANIPSKAADGTRKKVIDAGLVVNDPAMFAPWRAKLAQRLGVARLTVGVFENLHWTRFSDDYRRRFLDDLQATADALPGVRFLLKPHPEGRWLTERFGGARPQGDNILLIDPADPLGRLLPAPDLMPLADCVITTPSKTALDAALAGAPVAVAAYDGAYACYPALRTLASAEDWRKFVNLAAVGAPDLQERNRKFAAATVSSVNGRDNILSLVRETLA